VEYYRDVLRRQAVVNKGITFRFRNQVGKKFEEETFCYNEGIKEYIEELVGDNAFTMPAYWETERRGRDADNRPEMKLKITASFCFSKQVSHVEYYHNSSWLEYGGSPDRAVRLGFTAAFDKYLKDSNKYNKNESKILYQDIQDSLVLVTNCFSTIGCFENQTKKSVNSKFTQEAMTAFFKEQLQVWFIENKQEADKAADQILLNKRARESAEKTRSDVKKKLSGKVDIANRVQKFVDCRSKDANLRELYIVEGDSALGSVKFARDSEFQGIMPVRGKILNCLKADYNKIFASPIITDLMKVLGCGVEIQGKKAKDLSSFDIENLRWNKVIICTDADVDGFQIRTLILTMLYRLCPTLIRDGYVYIAESPLFEITYKDKTWFAYNEAEKVSILKELEGKKPDIQRSKGLGENTKEMMWMTTMNPETRRLIKVMPEDAARTAYYFDVLLGDSLNERKNFIAENGSKYVELADIS
jgi:DNA gyrase subunit B